MALKVVFMGTPDFSVPALQAIIAAGHDVVAAYSQPPRPAGRGLSDVTSPVQQAAEAAGIAVFTPKSLKSPEEQALFATHDADVAVVVAYGLLLPPEILKCPRYGCLNGHASKLPRWRGAAPIQRAIMAGDTQTAMMIMRMEQGLDTGPVCLSEDVAINEGTSAGALHDDMKVRGARLMVAALALLEKGELRECPQPPEGVTYATKISKTEAEIDFARPAREVLAHIHGLSPFPGAWFETAPQGGRLERVKVLRAALTDDKGEPGQVFHDGLTIACQEGAIRLVEVQRAGKKPMAAEDFKRGFMLPPGTRIGPR